MKFMLAIILILVAAEALAQGANRQPTFFKVFSEDGRESITANCSSKLPESTGIRCAMVNVRFQLPEVISLEAILGTDWQKLSDAERRKQETEFMRDMCGRVKDVHESGPKGIRFIQDVTATCKEGSTTKLIQVLLERKSLRAISG